MMIAIALIAMTATAQRGGGERGMKDVSAEDQATLQTKKLTLALALNESQSKKVYQINLAQANDRKAKMEARKKGDKKELTSEKRVQRRNEILDARITTQNKMKNILTEDQFTQWRKMSNGKGKGKRKGKGNRKREGEERRGRK